MSTIKKQTGRKSGQPTTGISRIDQPSKHNHGFYVRITRKGKQFAKFFSDKKNGSKSKALEAAKAHYLVLVAENPLKTAKSLKSTATQ